MTIIIPLGISLDDSLYHSAATSLSAAPNISNGPSSICATKPGNQVLLTIFIQTDSKSEENSFKVFNNRNGLWEEKLAKSNLKSNQLNRYDKCLFFKSCIRFEMYDTVGDGIAEGYYSIYFDDVKVAYSQFENGMERLIFGISCENEL